MQINLLPLRDAEKNPVGAAREKPNDDPFLPEPVRKVRSYFSSDFMKWVWRIIIFGVILGGIVLSVVGTGYKVLRADDRLCKVLDTSFSHV